MEETERKPIFTNTYVPNEETDRQTYRSIRFVRRLIVFLLSAAFLCQLAYWMIKLIQWVQYYQEPIYTKSLFWICIVGFVLYGYLIVREIFMPRILARRLMKRLKESYGTEQMEIVSEFFDDAVELHNRTSKNEQRFVYSAFKKVTETRDLFLLWTGQKQIVEMYKLGFDGTDIIGFRAFMDEKCPNAKRKWKKAE